MVNKKNKTLTFVLLSVVFIAGCTNSISDVVCIKHNGVIISDTDGVFNVSPGMYEVRNSPCEFINDTVTITEEYDSTYKSDVIVIDIRNTTNSTEDLNGK